MIDLCPIEPISLGGLDISKASPGRYPVFASRPTISFISRWRRHIEDTGSPETFECVSTDKPVRGAKVLLLSSDISVPIGKRGGERVPCPLCSPNSPKFGTGRMAWFPDDKTARFIGHTCARRYLGENYRLAERQFQIEQKCAGYQALWGRAGKKLDALDEFARKLAIPAKALQFTREYLDGRADGFADFLFRDRMHHTGRLPYGVNEKAGSGALKGLAFLSPDFAPCRQIETVRTACDDLRKPLPEWTAEDGENDAAREIMRRGRKIDAALKLLPTVHLQVVEGQAFLAARNLRILERWATGGLSPFDTLIFRWNGSKVLLRSTSFAGSHYCDLLVHPDFNADVPKFHKTLEI